ncbi:MAG TPA: hypothetical protein VM450_12350 [Thermomicrobiales bacterium]|nr:hypothetical protein [Thermomicrobiales bacterium]
MSDITALTTQARAEQITSEIDDTAGRAVAHRAALIAGGFTATVADQMAAEYHGLVLERHFGWTDDFDLGECE